MAAETGQSVGKTPEMKLLFEDMQKQLSRFNENNGKLTRIGHRLKDTNYPTDGELLKKEGVAEEQGLLSDLRNCVRLLTKENTILEETIGKIQDII